MRYIYIVRSFRGSPTNAETIMLTRVSACVTIVKRVGNISFWEKLDIGIPWYDSSIILGQCLPPWSYTLCYTLHPHPEPAARSPLSNPVHPDYLSDVDYGAAFIKIVAILWWWTPSHDLNLTSFTSLGFQITKANALHILHKDMYNARVYSGTVGGFLHTEIWDYIINSNICSLWKWAITNHW